MVEYEFLAKRCMGEEARCRYALLLMRAGKHDQAREIFEHILLHAERSPRRFCAAEREWIQTARRQIKD